MAPRDLNNKNTELKSVIYTDAEECLRITHETSSPDAVTVHLEGYVIQDSIQYFRSTIGDIAADHPDAGILADCEELVLIAPKCVSAIRELLGEGIKLTFTNLNQDCYAALWEAGLDGIVGEHMEIPHYDTSGYQLIGEGANGRVYRVDGELILKTFKNREPLDNILRERYLSKYAFQAGVPCPISFGLAEVDGKIALLTELVRSKSLLKLIREDDSNIEKYAGDFVKLIRSLHGMKAEQLSRFPRMERFNTLLEKADKLDELMDEGHKGRIRSILESIDEEEVLVHCDLQPGNVRVGDDGLSFIDMETLSTGPEILDVGGLRRSLHCDWEFSDTEYSDFMKLSKDQCTRIWDIFIKLYYEGEDEAKVQKSLYLAEIISDILAASQFNKRGQTDRLEKVVQRLKELINKQQIYM